MSPQPARLTMKLCNHSFFAWMPVDCIRKTFECSTQVMLMALPTYLRKRHQSENPAANIFCHDEVDATDNIFSDTPTVDGDQTAAQNFAGRHSKLASVHPSCDTSEKETLGIFQDCVRWYGTPDELVTDNAVVYHGFKFMKYVCNLYVQLWQSQSYHQHHNFAENVWQSFKQGTNQLLDFLVAAKNLFLFALIYYAFLWNHTVDTTIGDGSSSPYTFAAGCADDITSNLSFHCEEPMYCPLDQAQSKYKLADTLSNY